jgi:tetratricopeptide (TPR) repeat protein
MTALPLLLALLLPVEESARSSSRVDAPTQCTDLASTDPQAALNLVQDRLPQAEEAGDAKTVVALRLCAGYADENAGRSEEALRAYESVVADAERLAADDTLALALALRGEQRHERGLFDAALEDLQRAYRLSAEKKFDSTERYALNAIATVYADDNVGDFDRALEYYRLLLVAHEKTQNPANIATSHFNIGATLEKKGEFEGALVELTKALDIERQRKLPGQIGYCERAIGINLTKAGRPKDALVHLQAAYAAFEEAKDADMLQATRLSRGAAMRRAGRVQEALADLDAVLVYYEKQKDDRFLKKVYEERTSALAAAARWPEALDAQKAAFDVERRLNETQKQQNIARLRIQFDAERKEKENAALQRENALKTRVLMLSYALVGVLLLGLVGLFFWRRRAAA